MAGIISADFLQPQSSAGLSILNPSGNTVMASVNSAGIFSSTGSLLVANTGNVFSTGNVTASGTITGNTITSAYTLTSNIISSAAGSNFLLQTNGGTTAVTVDTSQRVGVNITPSSWSGYNVLEIGGGGASSSLAIQGGNNGATYLTGNLYNNGSNWIYKNSNYGTYYAQFVNSGTHAWFIAGSGSAGGTASPSQSMTLNSSAQWSLNTTNSSLGGTASQANIYVSNFATTCGLSIQGGTNNASSFTSFVNYAGTSIGSISQVNGSTIAFNTTSDSRLKNRIGVATDTYVIDNIVVNDFTWKIDGTTDRGVFAQDAQKIKPSAVRQGTDDLNEEGLPIHPWGVDYSKFVPDLIVYCQQLKKQITVLESRLAAANIA